MTETTHAAHTLTPTDDIGGQLGQALVQVKGLVKYFPIKRGVMRRTVGHIKAVAGITFDIYKGETLGLVARWAGAIFAALAAICR